MDGRLFGPVLLCGLWLAGAAAAGQPSAELPLVLEPAPAGSHGPLVLLLSGDGNWAPFPRAFAEAAAGYGAPVVGLKAREYMSHPVTAAGLAAALGGVVHEQLEAWQRTDLVVVGYSRGADWAPFVLNRWPAALRDRVRAVAFVGLSEQASFEFRLEDLFRDVKRPSDVPVRPEVDKLEGLPMICVYGDEEKDSFCRHPVPGMEVLEHPGGHRVKDDENLIAYLLGQLGITAKIPRPARLAGSPSPP